MFRLVFGLSDPCEDVRYFVESVFSRILLPRYPNVFANNFLDCICALNNFSGLPSYQGAVGNECFSLLEAPERRTMVYRFMLGKLPEEQRFVVSGAIVQDLLSAFTEGENPLPIPEASNAPLAAVLTDSLALLCCSELKVCFRHQKTEESGEFEEEIKQKAVLSVLKQNVTDHVVPILLALRTKLQGSNSPFLRDVTISLREILKDFKENIEEVVQDGQLAREIRFDIEQLDAVAIDRHRKSLSLGTLPCTTTPLSMRGAQVAMAEGTFHPRPTESPATISSPTRFWSDDKSKQISSPGKRSLDGLEERSAQKRLSILSNHSKDKHRLSVASSKPRLSASGKRVVIDEDDE